MAGAFEANAAAFLNLAALGLSAILLAVSLLSWRRLRHPRLLFVAGAFVLLGAQGALQGWAALRGEPTDLALASLDFAVVVLLYGSVAKR